MRIQNFALALLSLVATASIAPADLVSYWDFSNFDVATNNNTPTGNGVSSIAATQGTGTLSLAGYQGRIGDLTGTTLNSLSGTSTKTIVMYTDNGVASPALINGSYIQFDFSMAGFDDLTVSYAQQGSGSLNSYNGSYQSGGWSYSTDGTTYAPVVGAVTALHPEQNYKLFQFSTDLLDGADTASLRFTLTGATTTGRSVRLDNIQFNATPVAAIPEPTAALLGGVIASALTLTASRRRPVQG